MHGTCRYPRLSTPTQHSDNSTSVAADLSPSSSEFITRPSLCLSPPLSGSSSPSFCLALVRKLWRAFQLDASSYISLHPYPSAESSEYEDVDDQTAALIELRSTTGLQDM